VQENYKVRGYYKDILYISVGRFAVIEGLYKAL
jgi:hypothetical protein